jgi:hypothetical protein
MSGDFEERLEAGLQFEDFIADCYRTRGWRVFHRGRDRQGADLGIDIVATRGSRYELVQCKRWTGHDITEREVLAFVRACASYRARRGVGSGTFLFFEEPTFRCVFATTSVLTPGAKEIAAREQIVVREQVNFERQMEEPQVHFATCAVSCSRQPEPLIECAPAVTAVDLTAAVAERGFDAPTPPEGQRRFRLWVWRAAFFGRNG